MPEPTPSSDPPRAASPQPPKLRRGEVADAQQLSTFMRKVFSQAFAAQNDPEDLRIFFEEVYVPSQQRAELEDPHTATFLVFVEEELVAYAQLRERALHPPAILGPHPIELQRLYVDASWHGRGLADRLLQAVLDEAQRRSAETLWLGVWEHNPRGQAFYRKNHFVVVGSHTFLLGKDRQTDWLMSRPVVVAP